MKFLIPILLLVLFCSCNNENLPVEKKQGQSVSRFNSLDKNFKSISYDTIYVYSSENVESPTYQFAGTKMDSVQVMALSARAREQYQYNKDFFSCYKFSLDTLRTAFIVRLPGEYVSSVVKLFVFDKQKDSVVKDLFLADVFGDAGEVYTYRSCIFLDAQKKRHVLTYINSLYDHSVGDDTVDTAVEEWNYYHLFDLHNKYGDTLSKDSGEIVHLHNKIVQKLTGE